MPTTDLTYPIVTLTEGVVMPDMVVTITVSSPEAKAAASFADPTNGGTDELILSPRGAKVAVFATVENRHGDTLTLRGRHRVTVAAASADPSGALVATITRPTENSDAPEVTDLSREYRILAETVLGRVGGRRLAAGLREITEPGALADSMAYWPDLSPEQRVSLLETVNVAERLRLGIGWLRETLAELDLREKITSEVTSELEDSQRKAILRRQMAAIQSELDGEGSGEAAEYQRRLDDLGLADRAATTAVAEAIQTEIDRLGRTSEESMESSWLRTWLDVSLGLPWNERSSDAVDLAEARSILESGHTGLQDVKDRLLEYLAVRKLRHDRGLDGEDNSDQRRNRQGVLLALVGPPGVGKTSLGESVAETLGRSFVRIALGGVRDEAEIRGHRRTYVGARPGRIVRAIQEAGTMNPVVLLDEIDKLAAGWQGDPTAALLEVLDPAQNSTFRDHYLEFELDLSEVVFIATANTIDTIPGPLLDRLEIITIDGYTEPEKVAIGRDHLLPRLIEANGLRPDEVEVTEAALDVIVADYAPGAGVRHLERRLDKLVRSVAASIAETGTGETGIAETGVAEMGVAETGTAQTGDEPEGAAPEADAAIVVLDVEQVEDILGPRPHREEPATRIDRPGVVAGLAVTGAGGDVLFVEAALVPGAGDPVVTGQLGDVMKESVRIAQSVVAQRGLAVPEDHHLHIHFPAGAVPKDGPSAGVTLVTAISSLLSETPARPSVAMTGEVTLHGRVLPIGGVKQKLLAAHRNGLREVLLPEANGPALDDVPDHILDELTVHLVADVDRVVSLALA